MGSCLSLFSKGGDALDESKLTSLVDTSKKQKSPTRSTHEERMSAIRARIRAAQERTEGPRLENQEIPAAMQVVEESEVASRVYYEAPNDVFELIVSLFSNVDENGNGKGGLNTLRLVSKRFKQAAEAVATRLTQLSNQTSLIAPLPYKALMRCKMMERVKCDGYNIPSLQKCPDGLKSLVIANARFVTSLEPLSACARLEAIEMGYTPSLLDLTPLLSCTKITKLHIGYSKISSLAFMPSLPLLEDLSLGKGGERDSIKDLSPLCHCRRLRKLAVRGNVLLDDLSPLSQCPDLEELNISNLPLIKDLSFIERGGFTKLRLLDISYVPLKELSPLIRLTNLEELECPGIPSATSLYPLTSCYKLKKLHCMDNAKDLKEVRETRPQVEITKPGTELDLGRSF